MDLMCKEHNKKIKYFCISQKKNYKKCTQSQCFLCIICIKKHDIDCFPKYICHIDQLSKIKFETFNQNNDDVYIEELTSLKQDLDQEIDRSLNTVYENLIDNAQQIDYNLEDLQNIEKIKDIKKFYKLVFLKDAIIFQSKMKKTMNNLNKKLRSFKEVFEENLNQSIDTINDNFILNTRFLSLIDFENEDNMSLEQISDRRFYIQNIPTSSKQFNSIKINVDKDNLFFKIKIKKKSGFFQTQKVIKFNVQQQLELEPDQTRDLEQTQKQLQKFSDDLNLQNCQNSLEYYVSLRTWPKGELIIYDQDYKKVLRCLRYSLSFPFQISIKGNQIYVEISQEQII